MGHSNETNGHLSTHTSVAYGKDRRSEDDVVLNKAIFNKVFERDIRKVFLYKKIERITKALHLVSPAFETSPTLRERLLGTEITLLEASVAPLVSARTALSRELLILLSLLSLAETSGLLSRMNVSLISREIEDILKEIANYEEPQITLDETDSLAQLAKSVVRTDRPRTLEKPVRSSEDAPRRDIKDNDSSKRRDTILSVIRSKGSVSIKDISTVLRDVSEKTVQRELISLISAGVVAKKGERRWSTYSLS